ncbi:Pkinase-domain-containing protein [Mycena rebaudengoi]|nr:Pkinase-domain-containing protein [Mycena rebaudengoi]
MNPTRIVVKNTGFKPIGQSSSALKKFFPGDEDDMDISSDLSGVADSEVQVPEPPSPHLPPRPPEQQPRSEPLHASLPMRPADDVGVVELPRRLPSPPPLGISRDSSPSSPPLHTPKQADLDASDNADISMSSTRTRNELYAIVSQVGEGTFGKVYKAQNTVTKLHVALKRIRMESEKEGFPVTAMREIKLLQSLRHENVIQLYEMMVSNGSVYMVFEYMDHDLTGILSQTQFSFTDAHLKSLSHQMLAGLAYLHHKGVIHRDIKGSNILINNQGELKLADFGLARFYQKRRRTDYTNRVITLWYRPPELLFGATIYGPEVDMWSAGCIMLELFTKKPVFQGNDEIHQLDTIYRVIGTPTTDRWPGVANLPLRSLTNCRFRWMSPVALDLAERLLCYDPSARATALQAMEAPYFTQEEPRAMAPVGSRLATLHGEWHELDTKRERAKKRRRTETAIQ